MDRMKAPQEWNAVKGAMNGVLGEIRDDNRERQLDEKRQASYGVDQPRNRQPPGRIRGRHHHRQRDQLGGQVRGHEVEQIVVHCGRNVF